MKDGRRRLEKLNELEYVRGELLANIWYEDLIARIDPVKGELIGWIDCTNVYPARSRPDQEHVLNGIAYDADTGSLLFYGGITIEESGAWTAPLPFFACAAGSE